MVDPMTLYVAGNTILNALKGVGAIINKPKMPKIPDYTGILESAKQMSTGTYLNRGMEGLKRLSEELAQKDLPPQIAAKIMLREKDNLYRNAATIENKYDMNALNYLSKTYSDKLKQSLVQSQYANQQTDSILSGFSDILETYTLNKLRENESLKRDEVVSNFMDLLEELLKQD